MRNTKTIEIEGHEKPITVYELTVKQIIGFMQDDVWKTGDDSLDSFRKVLDTKLLPVCCTITMEDLIGMTPGEIEKIWLGFKEVNSVFFEAARRTGIQEMLDTVLVGIKSQLKGAITEDFLKLAALLPSPDTQLS
jgi:hypothetical protein